MAALRDRSAEPDFADLLREAGITREKPLFHVLTAAMEAAEAAKAPQSERRIRELQASVLKGVSWAVVRQAGVLVGAIGVASALAGGFAGFYAGQLSVVPSLAWASIIRANPGAPTPTREWTDPDHRLRAGEFRLWLDAPPAIVPPRR